MTRVIFVGTGRDADLVAAGAAGDGELIAVTADAADRLAELGLDATGVGKFNSGGRLPGIERQAVDAVLRLARGFDEFAARSAEPRVPGCGVLAAQAYEIFLALSGIATRVALLEMAVQALRPDEATIVDTSIHPRFAGDGYERQPWFEAVEASPWLSVLRPELIDGAVVPPSGEETTATRVRDRASRAVAGVARRISEARDARLRPGTEARPLFVDGPHYEWKRLAARMRAAGSQASGVEGAVPEGQSWRHRFVPAVTSLAGDPPISLHPRIDPDTPDEHFAELFDEWRTSETPTAVIDGADLFRALTPRLRRHVEAGPAIGEHSVEIAREAIAAVRPDVVCFSHVATLSRVRFAEVARERGVPTAAFQHGGSYGTHRLPLYEIHEARHVDTVLTYGPGIEPPDGSTARHVAVGSSRVEAMRTRRVRQRARGRTRVLWVAEATIGNAVGGTYLLEDTRRYRLETRGLRALAASTELTYRPFPGQAAASMTTRFAARELDGVRIDGTSRFDDLMRRADVMITVSASGTTWNEAIALGTPLVVFYGAEQAPLNRDFAADLAAAARLCGSEEELLEVCRLLRAEPVASVVPTDPEARRRFLERYVLRELDGRCVERAASELTALT